MANFFIKQFSINKKTIAIPNNPPIIEAIILTLACLRLDSLFGATLYAAAIDAKKGVYHLVA
ncbi:MAG: hypothetical protein L6U99_02235 [Clostridium sp.]|nr:MAG: hypothetical protein L6U99_02235 [Clostridium sp.]